MNQKTKVKLSDRVRPECEVATWVHKAILAMEATMAEQAREIERLRGYEGEWERLLNTQAAELAALKAQQGAAVMPDWLQSSRAFVDRLYAAGWRDYADAQHAGAAGLFDELVTRLNASRVPRELLELIDEAMCDFLGEDDPLLGDLRALLAGGRL
jgi:hypothetical protein